MGRWTPLITRISNRRPRLTSRIASPPLVIVVGGASGRRCETDRFPFLGSIGLVSADLRPHGPLNRNNLDSVLSTGDRTHTATTHTANAVNADAGRTRAVARAMATAHRPCNNTDRSACRAHGARSTQPLPAPQPLDSEAGHIFSCGGSRPNSSATPPPSSSDRSHAVISCNAEG